MSDTNYRLEDLFWLDDVESPSRYQPGGYHPVMIDDLIHNRYRIMEKLGHGTYSTIWLVSDEQNQQIVALKIGTSNPPSILREHAILTKILGASLAPESANNQCRFLPRIFDYFQITGPNGTHWCYTSAVAACDLEGAKYGEVLPIEVARAMAANLALATSFIHSRGVCHGGNFTTEERSKEMELTKQKIFAFQISSSSFPAK